MKILTIVKNLLNIITNYNKLDQICFELLSFRLIFVPLIIQNDDKTKDYKQAYAFNQA